jgi:enoyl-[acyl-carrier-protein] reductase (NADH)
VPGGKIDHVFLSGGGLVGQSIASEITEKALTSAINQKVFSVIESFKALRSLIKDEATSSLTIVTGGAGEVCFYPPLALLTVANAAQFGIVQALISETAVNKFRVNELRVKSVIKSDHEAENPDFKGIPAANTSLLAKFFVGKVLLSTIKGEIVHVNGSDLT